MADSQRPTGAGESGWLTGARNGCGMHAAPLRPDRVHDEAVAECRFAGEGKDTSIVRMLSSSCLSYVKIRRARGYQLKVCSLFSGIGGFELGLSRAGFETVLMCEKDELARSVLKFHFPETPIRADVTKLRQLPDCDLLTAGWPCQDLSQAGRTVGIVGDQSGLVSEVFRLVKSKRNRPEFVLLENVAFSLQLQGGAAINFVTNGLSDLGYNWAYRILDSRQFGLAQRRRRIFILASLSYDPVDILFQGAELADQQPHDEAVKFGFYWTEGNTGLGWSPEAVPPLKGGSTISIPSPPAIWDSAKQHFFKPGIVDAEKMQGFPADWTFVGKLRDEARRARWKLIGNAVSVPVATFIGHAISAHVFGERLEAGLKYLTKPPKLSAHNAGCGGPTTGRSYFKTGEGPYDPRALRLNDFAFVDPEPLSSRAARGFLSRIERSSLRTHPRFIPDLRSYVS